MTTTNSSGLHLILMKGFPATGKSSLAQSLSRSLAWPLIDKDDIKDFTLHLENGNALAYEIMWAVAGRQLQLGLSVIVDSPLTYPEQFQVGQVLASDYGAQLLVVEIRLSDAAWRQRLETRDRRESEHKIAGWSAMQAMLAKYDGCWQYDIPPESHMIVDASEPAGALWARLTLSVLSRLGLHQNEHRAAPRGLPAPAGATARAQDQNCHSREGGKRSGILT